MAPTGPTEPATSTNPTSSTNNGFTEGGDVTLRSIDGVDFSVHSLILSLASPIFSDLLKLSARREAIRFGETSEVLALMLKFIYPRPPPAISTFDLLGRAICVADKYQLEGMKSHLREKLTLIESPVSIYADPLRALSVASAYGFQHEADLAAVEASKRYDLQNRDDLVKLVEAVPPSSTLLVKLIGARLVKTKVLADVLLAFHEAPMKLGNDYSALLCGVCQKQYYTSPRHSPPEWQARWAYWAFIEASGRPVEAWDELFKISFFNTMFNRSGLPAAASIGCTCSSQVNQNTTLFEKWASNVQEHLKNKLSGLDKLEPSKSL